METIGPRSPVNGRPSLVVCRLSSFRLFVNVSAELSLMLPFSPVAKSTVFSSDGRFHHLC